MLVGRVCPCVCMHDHMVWACGDRHALACAVCAYDTADSEIMTHTI